MTWGCPPEVEEALWRAARALIPERALAPSALTAGVVERSRRYTTDRDRLAAHQAEKPAERDLAARALFFTVADVPKVMVPLAELAGRGLLPAGRTIRVLDAGAGAGAMSLGTIAHYARRVDVAGGCALEIRALDRDAAALAVAERAVAELPAGWRDRVPVLFRAERTDVSQFSVPREAFDLVLAGSLLNELEAAAAHRLAGELVAAVRPGGAVILVGPALRETARRLHRLRDALVAGGAARVFAPCTRQGGCPALADERDWCHEDRPASLPPRAARMSAATGLRAGRLKFAYLVMRRAPEAVVEVEPESGLCALRVVSEPKKRKGALECFVCGEAGRFRLRRLSRNRSDANRDLDRAARGDVLLAACASEVGREDAVVRVTPAGRGE